MNEIHDYEQQVARRARLFDVVFFSLLGAAARFLSIRFLPPGLAFPLSVDFALVAVAIGHCGILGMIPLLAVLTVQGVMQPATRLVSLIGFFLSFSALLVRSRKLGGYVAILLILIASQCAACALLSHTFWGFASQLMLMAPSLALSLILVVVLSYSSTVLRGGEHEATDSHA